LTTYSYFLRRRRFQIPAIGKKDKDASAPNVKVLPPMAVCAKFMPRKIDCGLGNTELKRFQSVKTTKPKHHKTMPTQNETPQDIAKIHLKMVRLSYPHLFTPKIMKGSNKAKYSADLILDKKEHASTIAKIEKTIDRVALDFFKKAVKIKDDKKPLHDGNEKDDKDGYGDDVMFITAKNDKPPIVVDQDPSVALTAISGKPYGGCYVNAVIRIYAYAAGEGYTAGVSASLEAVQFAKDGPAFGAGPVDAEKEFSKVEGDSAEDY